MDELDQLTGARPDPTPDAEVVEAHRAALRAAMNAADAPAIEAEAPLVALSHRRRTRRWLPVAAAVAVVAAVGVAVTQDDDPTADLQLDTASTTAPPVASTAVQAAAATMCGALPFDLVLPDGFTLTDESAPDDGRLSQTYVGPSGSVVLTWPTDDNTLEHEDDVDVSNHRGPDAGWMLTATEGVDGDGRTTLALTAAGSAIGTSPCDALLAEVVGDDDIAAGTLAVAVQDSILAAADELPLVTVTNDHTGLPMVGPCESPTSPNVGEVIVDGTVSASPEAALEAFLAEQTMVVEEFGIEVERPRHPTFGYEQLHLSDGIVAFAHEPNPARPDFVGTLVVVSPVELGWTVTRWEASGC